jgi:hypothetical protein
VTVNTFTLSNTSGASGAMAWSNSSSPGAKLDAEL